MGPQQSPSRVADQFMVRFPDGMRQQLKAMAALNRRSLNAEVIVLIERALASANAATGEGLANTAPAAASNRAACQGSAIDQRP